MPDTRACARSTTLALNSGSIDSSKVNVKSFLSDGNYCSRKTSLLHALLPALSKKPIAAVTLTTAALKESRWNQVQRQVFLPSPSYQTKSRVPLPLGS
jgi:hypothetical protein